MGGANSQPGKQGSASSGAEAKPVILKYRIASDFSEGRVVQKEVMDAVIAARFNEHDVFAVKLALEEALINAIKHGNKHDPAKWVVIEARVTHDNVEIEIEDQGAGFARTEVPDPTLEENLEKPSGRGILLIESYMTHAEWSKGGRKVRMSKRREDAVPNSA